MAGGRPTRYRKEFAEQARKLCLLGYTDVQLADFFEVTEKTINNWKNRHSEFLQSIKKGKAIPDAEVAETLFNKAAGRVVITEVREFAKRKDDLASEEIQLEGIETEDSGFDPFSRAGEVQIIKKQLPPSDIAAIFWLKNRQPELWRDKVEEKPPATQSAIMPIPTCDNVDDWEEVAQSHQAQIINA